MLKKCFDLPNDIENKQEKNDNKVVNIQLDDFEEKKLNDQKNENNSESEEKNGDEIINPNYNFHQKKEIKRKQLIVEQNNEFIFLLFSN